MLDYLQEAMKLFKELTPENQANLLIYTRVAHAAENSVKKYINRTMNEALDEGEKQEGSDTELEPKA